MAMIEGFRIKNYRVLKNVTLGKLWNTQDTQPLTPMTAVIGKNGVGKSTLFDAFGFLDDCLQMGVEEACDARGRGGFRKLKSMGQSGAMEFEIYYRQEPSARPITYELAIDEDTKGRPYVKSERLRQRRKGQDRGWPFSFLILNDGNGVAWTGLAAGVKEDQPVDLNQIEESSETIHVELDDNRRLAIATLGALKQHPRIAAFRSFIEGWYLSYFTPDAARGLPMAGPQRHLSIHGDNLGNVVQYMEREYPDKFNQVLSRIAMRIPGINHIKTEKSLDDRLLLCFNDKGFNDPFFAQQMSDGTLKLFAYLLLLEDPSPAPFLCIEEPENGLYHQLLETLATEFRTHATGRKGGTQVFVTTHQPYFVNALKPEEVWILEKGAEGFSTIRRASADSIVTNMVAEGLPLGGLWYSDYLEAR
jgi:predicted ATPase